MRESSPNRQFLLFPVFSKHLYCRHKKSRACLGRVENIRMVSERVENIVGKGENAFRMCCSLGPLNNWINFLIKSLEIMRHTCHSSGPYVITVFSSITWCTLRGRLKSCHVAICSLWTSILGAEFCTIRAVVTLRAWVNGVVYDRCIGNYAVVA